ncbi:MAG: lysostaphin resistance A-like protein [Exilispira sp.]
MKKPGLYYFSLILTIVSAQIFSIYLSKIFIVKNLNIRHISIEYLSKFILSFFLFLQYLLYIKLNKTNAFFNINYESSNYLYLEEKNNLFSDFYKGKNPASLRLDLLWFSFLFFFILTIIGSNLQLLLNPIFKNTAFFKLSEKLYFKAITNLLNEDLFLSFFLIVIIGPIIEEIAFRGFSLSFKFDEKRSTIVIILMSIIFATIHFDFSRIITLFAMGLGLGLIYNLTESLIYPIIIHILNNGLAFIIIFIMLKSQNNTYFENYLELKANQAEMQLQNSIILIITIFFLIIWAIYIYKKIKSEVYKF